MLTAIRTAWWVLAGAVVCSGLLIGYLILGPVQLAILAGTGAAGGAFAHPRLKHPALLGTAAPTRAATSVTRSALALLGVMGLTAALGPNALALTAWLTVVGLALHRPQPGSPPCGDRGGGRELLTRRQPPTRVSAPLPVDPAADSCYDWSRERLCWAWRASIIRLHQVETAADLACVVAERRAYLDELERQDARGFHAWLTDGARAASDPSRYLTSDDT